MRNRSFGPSDWTRGSGRANDRQATDTNADASGPGRQAEDSPADTSPVYSDAAVAELLYMLEEEKLAGDIYEAFFEQTGVKIFDNIAKSEDKHHNALLNQAEGIGLDVDAIVFEPAGSYVNDEIQALYDDLLAYGSSSVQAALEVGVMIETKDIVDIDNAIDGVEGTRLADVYQNLLDGSENHLDAFSGMLVA
jgi:hypothetical protein